MSSNRRIDGDADPRDEFDEDDRLDRSANDDGAVSDPVVEYVDGGMDGETRRAFEAELAASPQLRREVRVARLVRGLVSSLPRVRADLPPVEALFEKLDAEPSPALGRLLRGLPRASAPALLRERVLRGIPAISRVRLGATPTGTWLRIAAAACILVAAVVALREGEREAPRKGPYRFVVNPAAQVLVPGFDAAAMPRHPHVISTTAGARR